MAGPAGEGSGMGGLAMDIKTAGMLYLAALMLLMPVPLTGSIILTGGIKAQPSSSITSGSGNQLCSAVQCSAVQCSAVQ